MTRMVELDEQMELRRGLERGHRLWSEPSRLAGRHARTNGEFILRAAIEILSARPPA